MVITADPELDDNNTLIRAILYSSEVRLEGLVYVSSQFHWRGDGQGTTQFIPGREYTRLGLCPCTSWRFAPQERFIDDIVDAYAKVYPNLKVHDPRYPTPAYLKSRIRWGNVDFDGDFSKVTPGSELIKALLLDDTPGPLYVTAQGGESTIARALKSIHDQYAATRRWDAIRRKVSAKLIIIPSGDQDGTDASYIRPNWPDVREYAFAGINYSYGAQNHAAPEVMDYLTPQWHSEHVSGQGPLGAQYRLWGDGKQMVKGDRTDYFGLSGYSAEQLKAMGYMVWTPPQAKGAFIGEGDTPTFLNLIGNGLRAYQDPHWGGWGGWTGPASAGFSPFGVPPPPLPPDTSGIARGLGASADAQQAMPAAVAGPAFSTFAAPAVPPQVAATATRWFAAAQNDFAMRLKWSVTPRYRDANHPPVVAIDGPLAVSAAPGSTVRLRATVSDPDHDRIAVQWHQFSVVPSERFDIVFSEPVALATTFVVPRDAQTGQTISVIVEATDTGTPAATRYQRVLITVR